MLIGYARVSKLDQQDTRAQVKALKKPDANEFSKKARPAVGGIDLNFTVRSITCDKVTCWWFGSLIAFHVR